MYDASQMSDAERRATRAQAILAANLRARMESRGLSANQLARLAGVAQNSVSHMVRPERRTRSKGGFSSPVLEKVEAVAHALGVEVWELLHPDPALVREVEHIMGSLVERLRERDAAISARHRSSPR